MLLVGTMVLLEHAESAARRDAENTVRRGALVAESTINRQFLQVDGALASLPALLDTVAGPNGLVEPATAARLLRGFNFQTFNFRDLLLLRPDGTLWVSARPVSRHHPPPIRPGDGVAGSSPGAVSVSGPYRNPLTGEWALYFARPMTVPGVGPVEAVAEVPLPLIATFLAPIAEVPGLRIALERRSGQLIGSLPHDEVRTGRILRHPVSAIRSDGNAFEMPAGAMPAPTIAAARPTLYSDILVAVTLDLHTAMADWSRDRTRLLAATSVATLLLIAVAVALTIALRQNEKVEAERARGRDMLANAIESMQDGFVMWDAQDRLLTCNQRYRELYEISGPAIHQGATFENILRYGTAHGQYPQAAGDPEGFVTNLVEWHRGDNNSLERLLPDGRWVLVTERRTPDGGVVGIRTEITAMKQIMSELAAANEQAKQAMAEVQLQNEALRERDHALHTQVALFNAALNNMSQGLCMVDAEQRLIVCNGRFRDMFALDQELVQPGLPAAELFRAVDATGRFDAETGRNIFLEQNVLAASHREGTFILAAKAGSPGGGRALQVSQRPMSNGGWVATYADITDQHQAEARIRFMAHHDALTRLPNRVLFRTRMDEALREQEQQQGPGQGQNQLALLCLDLDHFKNVNDTLGHPAGDALLETAARRLQGCVRETDIVARLGGDEFAVMQLAPNQPADAERLGRRIIEALGAPYELAGREVVVGVSVGIATVGAPGNKTGSSTGGTMGRAAGIDADTLLKNADVALYRAKAEGRGTCRVFETEMDTRIRSRLAEEADLRVALAQDQFHLAYQPIQDLAAGRVCGFEALLRWDHPGRGPVPPSHFIPLAEEIGLIVPIGEWVLRRACRDLATLPGAVRMAVNLSPLQLRNDDVVRMVSRAIEDSGVAPSRLELEITESALLQDNERTVALLHQLRDLGLSIALDDFGTGYSSLSYLRSFPFDKIKIDRSFVTELADREDCRVIVKSVATLAQELGMRTTAEGVETEDQLILVREAGCVEVQGHYFGRAKPLADAVTALSRPRLPAALQPAPDLTGAP